MEMGLHSVKCFALPGGGEATAGCPGLQGLIRAQGEPCLGGQCHIAVPQPVSCYLPHFLVAPQLGTEPASHLLQEGLVSFEPGRRLLSENRSASTWE